MRPRTLNEITITTVWPYEGAKPVSDWDNEHIEPDDEPPPHKPTTVCEHGRLRRSCADCDLIVADSRIRDIEAENARLSDRLAKCEGALERANRYGRGADAALAVAVDEVDAWRRVTNYAHSDSCDNDSGTCRYCDECVKHQILDRRAATDANELIRQYRASREQTR